MIAQSHDRFEEVTLREFIFFMKTYRQNLEENIRIYLNVEGISDEEHFEAVTLLLRSFTEWFHHIHMGEMEEDIHNQLIDWLYAQISILSTERLYLFSLILQKAVTTLLKKEKIHKNDGFIMFLFNLQSDLLKTYQQIAKKEKQIPHRAPLTKLSQLLIRSSKTELPDILKKCEDWFGFKRCVFYGYIPWSNEFYGAVGTEVIKVQSMKGQLGENFSVFSTKKPIFLKDPKQLIRQEHIELFGLSSIIFLPILCEEQLYGWLTFDQKGEAFEYSKEELDYINEVGILLGLFFSRKSGNDMIQSSIHLTQREHSILILLADGHDNKTIASMLYLSEHTVRDYVSQLMTKLKAKNRTQVVAIAFQSGLLH
ncbi:LuxR C-terminal-related transcriptional regulator [Cytobacillus sp. FSL K6-0129]